MGNCVISHSNMGSDTHSFGIRLKVLWSGDGKWETGNGKHGRVTHGNARRTQRNKLRSRRTIPDQVVVSAEYTNRVGYNRLVTYITHNKRIGILTILTKSITNIHSIKSLTRYN